MAGQQIPAMLHTGRRRGEGSTFISQTAKRDQAASVGTCAIRVAGINVAHEGEAAPPLSWRAGQRARRRPASACQRSVTARAPQRLPGPSVLWSCCRARCMASAGQELPLQSRPSELRSAVQTVLHRPDGPASTPGHWAPASRTAARTPACAQRARTCRRTAAGSRSAHPGASQRLACSATSALKA